MPEIHIRILADRVKLRFVVMLFFIIYCLFPTLSYCELNYETFFQNFEAALQQIKSYAIQSDTSINDKTTSVLLEFVRPAMQRQTITSETSREIKLFIKDKLYILVPGIMKWSEQEWPEGVAPLRELGTLDQILEMMKREKPSNIEMRAIEDVDYIVLEYTNVVDWGNIHLVFSQYTSSLKFYIDPSSYFLKLAIVEMSGNRVSSDTKLHIRQLNKFGSYNEKMDIAPPEQKDIFVPEPISTESPSEIFQSKMKEFKNSMQGIVLEYPEDWYIKEHEEEGIYQLFISKEKIEKPGDLYLTGIGISKIYNAKESMGLKATIPLGVADEYLTRYVEGIQTSTSVIMVSANLPIKVGKDTGYTTELTFTDQYRRMLTSLLTILYKNDTLVIVIMESTQQDFIRYRKIFMDILTEMGVF